jgi:hypothetical protein
MAGNDSKDPSAYPQAKVKVPGIGNIAPACDQATCAIGVIVALLCGAAAGAGFAVQQVVETVRSDQPPLPKLGRLALIAGVGVSAWFGGGAAAVAAVGGATAQYVGSAVCTGIGAGIGKGASCMFFESDKNQKERQPLINPKAVVVAQSDAPPTDPTPSQPQQPDRTSAPASAPSL